MNQNAKPFYQSRAIWLSIASILVGCLTEIHALDLTPQVKNWIIIVIGILGLFIRLSTTEAIAK